MTSRRTSQLRKILFLDIDGVLNSVDWYKVRPKKTAEELEDPKAIDKHQLDPRAMIRLNRLVKETGAEVVVISIWRLTRTVEELQAALSRNGFIGKVIGKTPAIYNRLESGALKEPTRGVEIQTWLDEQEENFNFVILDDGMGMGNLSGRHVRPSHYEGGLQDSQVDQAIALFGG